MCLNGRGWLDEVAQRDPGTHAQQDRGSAGAGKHRPGGLHEPSSPPQRLRGKAAVLAGALQQKRHMASHLMLHKILLKPNRLAKWFYAFNNK